MMKKILAAFLAIVFVMQFVPTLAIAGEANGNGKTLINRLNGLNNDITGYFDSSTVYRLPDTIKDNDEISVIVTLDTPTLMEAYRAENRTMSFGDFALSTEEAKSVTAQIGVQKSKALASLDAAGVSYTVGEEYSSILAGFEIMIKAADFAAACKALPAGADAIVGEEYYPAETQLVENNVTIYEGTGIFDWSSSGYDGSGMVVAVLDTGIDYNHSAFSTDNFTSSSLGLTYDMVSSALGDLNASELFPGLTVDDVYINEKIPYGFDYADEDTDPYSTHNDHGTHVSGVIAGHDDTITGVAPNAQIVSMKIFSDTFDTAKTAWILSALEDCVVLGVDVINVSLGTSCGFSREEDEEAVSGVYDEIRASGIALIAAASNSYSSAYGSEANGNLGLTSNPDTGTVGSPASYTGALAVASISGTKTPYIKYDDTIIYFLEATNSASQEKHFCDELLGDAESKTLEYVVISGAGRTADYSGVDVKGKIALVRRGSNTFEEKAIIAQQQGAAAIIIYNNVSGDIKMNAGDVTIPVCSISQTDGEMLAKNGGGKLSFGVSQTSGPFISDFSSWGPTPDLKIKPEITAHGGNILSCITGGSYDRMSGTSMACPNLAGTVILLKQHVKENYPEIANDNVAVTSMVYRLLMSTADIAYGENGLPYAVRKQGAGLANLLNAIGTDAYITTVDADGNEMDRTKLELGDDKEKSGVYEMTFIVNNIGDSELSYNIDSYVMTEGVSDTKTNSGETTVTEQSYLLSGAKLTVKEVSGGNCNGTKLTVKAGEKATVTVVITLSDSDKQYLDTSFENGMYVEGFIVLKAASGAKIDLSVPYLAFYGDWTKAPLFDLDYFETDADEKDDAIAAEDKTLASAYATRPIGGVMQDYIGYLGSYYFSQNPKDMTISADREYCSLSNQEGTVHSLRYVWAGLLRSAIQIDVAITNDTTGEVIYETTTENVRKSFGEGGSIYPANIEVDFDMLDYDLPNNTKLMVNLTAYLDYDEDGGIDTNTKNTFSFPITVDFEAPVVEDVRFYYEYDKTLKKNRLYADVDVYDNHYAMAAQLGYITKTEDENGDTSLEIVTFDNYLTPVYSSRNSTTTVKYELTDYIYDIKANAETGSDETGKSIVITLYDYALNYATYEISLPDAIEDFSLEGLEDGLTLNLNEVYTLAPKVTPATEWAELLNAVSSKQSVVRVVNDKLVAVGKGSAIIRVDNPYNGQSKTFRVNVLGEGDEGYLGYDKPVADRFKLKGYYTAKAFYFVDSNSRDIGSTGSTSFFTDSCSLTMYPSEQVGVQLDFDSYYPNDVEVVVESGNEDIVRADSSGVITAVAEGFASVTVKLVMDGKSTYYSETISVEVKNPYVTSGPSLSHYFGNGGTVTIPDDLSLTQIGSYAFANFEYVEKSEDELDEESEEVTKQWFIGENSITKVIIPEGVETIGSYAFANLTALTEVVLPSTLTTIEYGAFYGCSALEKITFSGANNLKIINQSAFENCGLTGTLELSSACIISDYAFAGNTSLEGVVTGDALISIGSYAFAACKKLETVILTDHNIKYGTYAFNGCKALKDFTVNSVVLPEGMFYECAALTRVTLGDDVTDIGEFAFRDTALETITVSSGNKAFKPQTASYVVSASGDRLVAVVPTLSGEFGASDVGGLNITAVGSGAFSHNRAITAIKLPGVTSVGSYAFASNKLLESVELGKLTDIGEYAYYETGITSMPSITAETEIGIYAFAFSELKQVTVPDGMTVAEGVFSECDELASVTVGDNVVLGLYAFGINKDNCFSVHNYDEGGNKYFYYEFSGALKELTIGDNVTIGERAFVCAAELEAVTLGANAVIDKMAFFNCCSLAEIDLSEVKQIGEYAFSGDVYYVCDDENMYTAAVSEDGYYIYSYFSPAITSVELSAPDGIGAYAFAYCRSLAEVKLGDTITEIGEYTFAGCDKLESVNLSNVVTVGDYAFMETALKSATLTSAELIGKYAFVDNAEMESVTLNPNGCELDEAAFAGNTVLADVVNLSAVKQIGDWAFAYTAITKAELSSAIRVGKQAFVKEESAEFSVTFGSCLESLGDNPFVRCELEPFTAVSTETVNGNTVETVTDSYYISDTVKVVDGSLYTKVPNGWVLVTYTGGDVRDVQVAEDTVRIASMAFAFSDVQMVTLPYTVTAIGHKAFYDCQSLKTVVFGSYTAPILEEEFDSTYFESLEHIPGLGNYGEYVDFTGEKVDIVGTGAVPYYMWNVTDGMYSNVYYGASFVDYVGTVVNKLMMVRPENGVGYDSYIMDSYFDLTVSGPTAPEDATIAAIRAINAIPDKVSLDDAALVTAARTAYDKIATLSQQALVTDYSKLITAEQRITALSTDDDTQEPDVSENEGGVPVWVWVIVCVGVVLLAAVAVFFTRKRPADKKAKPAKTNGRDDDETKA